MKNFYQNNNTQYTCFNEQTGTLTHVFFLGNTVDVKQMLIEPNRHDDILASLPRNLQPSTEAVFMEQYNHALQTLGVL